MQNLTFQNDLEITLIRGDEAQEINISNSIAEDFLCGFHSVYTKRGADADCLRAVLYPDGPAWNGWTWDPKDPWVPYGLISNHPDDSEAVDIYQSPAMAWDTKKNKWKLSYQWNKIDKDISLKAVGITLWDYFDRTECGVTGNFSAIPLGALAILPQPLLVKGRNGGMQIPDILQISYYFSLVGV